MKRSEMVNRLEIVLDDIFAMSDSCSKEDADVILKVCEDSGMLPPHKIYDMKNIERKTGVAITFLWDDEEEND